MRISDWSSDVCSSDLEVVDAQAGERRHQVFDRLHLGAVARQAGAQGGFADQLGVRGDLHRGLDVDAAEHDAGVDRGRSQGEVDLLAAVQPDAGGADHILDGALLHGRGWIRVVAMGGSEEHTSELQSLLRISYAVFCLKKKTKAPTSKKPSRTINTY